MPVTVAEVPSAPSTGLRGVWLGLAIAAAAVALSLWLDRAAWTYLVDARVYERDWGRLLRVMGYLPLWLALGLVLARHDVASRWHGATLAGAPVIGGLAAELVKLLVRRERPSVEVFGEYVFRPFTVETWSTRGLGLPSSHVLVAMAAATVLAQRFPRGRWLWYALAVGCGLTRVAARAHYLSDIVVALVLGWGVGVATWQRLGLRNAPRAGAQ
ncbi:MAG: phosphatase PAP2 family protein [Gemmatimonadaceae bacterium]|jgi:membrane-associated phospholipid phosphatase|nr:phosphatase PAP2 family protein [Gemmatimonadaceae bacterium]